MLGVTTATEGHALTITSLGRGIKNTTATKRGMLSQLLQQFQLTTDEALFIGDTWFDSQAAKSLGMDFVLVNWLLR